MKTKDNQEESKPVPATTYILISAGSVIVAAGIGYYYFHFLAGRSNGQLDDRIFYLVLLLFGVAVSALIFGIMNSYASLNGIQSNVTYKFTGPVVGVILTVLGGFLIPKGNTDEFLSIRVFDQDHNPVTRGKVTITFPQYQREAMINEKGLVIFPGVPYDLLRNRILINVVSDGYGTTNLDTLLSDFSPINISVSQARIIRIEGTVKDAADRPIKDVEVVVDGTPYFAKSINDGSFGIPLPGYHFGDRITLVTSHPGYDDKEKHFEIQSGAISNIEFVLNPVASANTKP